MLTNAFSIAVGAACGALLRWWLGLTLNSLFPAIPLGTLTANLVGGFLMGIMMGFVRHHVFLPEEIRLALTTGFLGGLTTFSTFSAEAITLFSHHEYLFFLLILLGHVVGSLVATLLGLYSVKLFLP